MAMINISPELSDRVEKTAARQGTSVEALIEELLGPPTVIDEVAAVKEALDASQQGKVRSAADFFTEHRQRNPEPSS